MNIADAITAQAQTRPHHPAIKHDGRTLSFATLDTQVDAMAKTLADRGLVRGDLVGLMLTTSVEHLVLIFGIARLGARLISFAPRTPLPEISAILENLELRLAVTQDGEPHFGAVDTVSLKGLADMAAAQTSADSIRAAGDHDILLYEQSSGTTGVPKLIPASHHQFDWWGELHVKHLEWVPHDRYIALIKLHFSFGRLLAVSAVRHGLTVVLSTVKTAEEAIDLVRQERITLMYLTPVHLRTFLNRAPERGHLFPGLRRLICSTSPLTPLERARARESITANFYETYGTNETGTLAVAAPEDHFAAPETVGRIIDSVTVDLLSQDGESVPPGDVGLIRFRNPALPTAYHENPTATAQHFRDGWFVPGDLALLDGNGRLFLKGRADDVIDNQGAKFYPIEVENTLNAHPAVVEAAVIGWQHQTRGIIPVGFVVLNDESVTAEDLYAFSRTQVSSHKIPRRIIFMKTLPRNTMGKVVKTQLAEVLRLLDAREASEGT